ncbi:hypothetical protein SAMN05428964_1156 [Thalassospira xiamenensis]|uniref:Uncharacterized protein n=1 Tax=Thalassospira xiamenensis TaxID=220697 RepID=A0A285TZQ6_9PROT|nr:hypothetical protein SAMN05428964_1156 [Thalassospira xiamenensis]
MRAVLPYLFCLTPIAFAGIFVFDRNLSLLLVPVGYFVGASGRICFVFDCGHHHSVLAIDCHIL